MTEHDGIVQEQPASNRGRHASFVRRAARTAHYRWQAMRNNVTVAAATVIVMAASIVAWRAYDHWQLGRIELNNQGTPLVVQVLAEANGEPLGEPIDLVTRATLSLPDGEYRLSVNGVGQLGATYRFSVNRGETQRHAISLDGSRLLHEDRGVRGPNAKRVPEQPMLFAPMSVPLELKSGAADMIEWNGRSLIRRDGVTGKVVWDALRPEKPFEKGRDPAVWLKPFFGYPYEPAIVQPAVDLDGDGQADIVCAFQRPPSLLALSGADGSILWSYTAELDGPGGPQPDGPVLAGSSPELRPGSLIGTPAVFDCDRDGTPDLISTLVFSESPREVQQRSSPNNKNAVKTPSQNVLSRRVVMAVSGRSGRSIWSHALDKEFAAVPYHSLQRWATVVRGRGAATVAVPDDERLIRLDSATGRPLYTPLEIGFLPVRDVQHGDLDGDGEPEVLALGPGPKNDQKTLAAFASGTGRGLWVQTVTAPYESAYDTGPGPDWPLVADSDGDGRCEVVVPDSGSTTLAGDYRGVRMLDGATGQTRWVRPMRPDTKADDRVEHIALAPDLDRDGTLDLVLLSRFHGRRPATVPSIQPSEPAGIYVDAVSGRDGHPLWWRRLEVEEYMGIRAPLWWGRGPDGWPLLALSLGGWHTVYDGMHVNRPGTVHALKASTGREVHRALGLLTAGVADLDGDGLADLWGDAEGELRAFRGPMPEAWRALGYFGAASRYRGTFQAAASHTADFDGDGIGDALTGTFDSPSAKNAPGTRTLVARSGRDGHALWKTSFDPPRRWIDDQQWTRYEATTLSLPSGDLDGDGTCDVLVKSSLVNMETDNRAARIPLELVSGRTGRHRWSAGQLPISLEQPGRSLVHTLNVCKLEPDAAPTILAAMITWTTNPSAPPMLNDPYQLRLTRLAGRDGRVVWDKLLLENMYSEFANYAPDPNLADLDRDGSLDAAMLVPLSITQENRGFELRAISLRDGALLWSRKIPTARHDGFPTPLVGDLDGDNCPEVVILSKQSTGGNRVESVLEALDGRDGKTRWSWHHGSEEASRDRWGGRVCLADFQGKRAQQVCLAMTRPFEHRLMIFDAAGQMVAHRDLSKGQVFDLLAADVNGDGCDELVVAVEHRLQVLSGDLQEVWALPEDPHCAGFIYLPSADTTPTLAVQPPMGLDAANGHPRWVGDARGSPSSIFYLALFDPGNATRLPLLLATGSGTVCYQALSATPAGKYAPPEGTPVPPGFAGNDPRWTRPLPWATRIDGSTGPWVALTCGGLSLVNVLLPLVILRLAARRRPWSIRVLMALPIAAAVPLMAYLGLEPMIKARSDFLFASPKLQFLLGTLAGIPVIFLAVIAGWAMLGRRVKTLGALAALTLIASASIAAIWLRIDMKSMPAIEHYGSPGWYLIALPGAYATGMIALIAWLIRGASRLRRRLRRRREAETRQLLTY